MVKEATELTGHGGDALFDEAFLRKLEYLHVVSRKLFAGANRGERRSRKLGTGLEFADHREYVLGDDLRYLDWNAFGRLERLLLRVFEEEEELWIHLLLDVSGSMGVDGGGVLAGQQRPGSRKFDTARRVTAALGYIGLANLDRVGVTAFGDRLGRRMEPTRGKAQIFRLLEMLRSLRPAGRTDIAAAARAFVHRVKRRGLAVLVSDLYDPAGLQEGIELLRYHRFEPYVVHIIDPDDAEPDVQGDLEIVDAETGAVEQVTITPALLRRLREGYERHLADAQEQSRRAAVPYFRASTEVPFEDLILRVFRAGGFVKA